MGGRERRHNNNESRGRARDESEQRVRSAREAAGGRRRDSPPSARRHRDRTRTGSAWRWRLDAATTAAAAGTHRGHRRGTGQPFGGRTCLETLWTEPSAICGAGAARRTAVDANNTPSAAPARSGAAVDWHGAAAAAAAARVAACGAGAKRGAASQAPVGATQLSSSNSRDAIDGPCRGIARGPAGMRAPRDIDLSKRGGRGAVCV